MQTYRPKLPPPPFIRSFASDLSGVKAPCMGSGRPATEGGGAFKGAPETGQDDHARVLLLLLLWYYDRRHHVTFKPTDFF